MSQIGANSQQRIIARREFLRFVAGSPSSRRPLPAPSPASSASGAEQALAQSYDMLRGFEGAVGADGVITAPARRSMC